MRGRASTMTVDARSGVCDLSTFLVFALADPSSDHGVVARSPREAADIALHGLRHGDEAIVEGDGRPSRALVMSVGPVPALDWYELLVREYLT